VLLVIQFGGIQRQVQSCSIQIQIVTAIDHISFREQMCQQPVPEWWNLR